MRLIAVVGRETLAVEVVGRDGRYRVRLGDEWLEVDARVPASGPVSLLIDGASYTADIGEENGEAVVVIRGETYRVRVEEAGRQFGRRAGSGAENAGQRLVSPMPGRVVSVHVAPGDRVERNAPLVVLEAMKMENEFRASAAGIVAEVHVSVGQAVNAGDLLVVVAPERAA